MNVFTIDRLQIEWVEVNGYGEIEVGRAVRVYDKSGITYEGVVNCVDERGVSLPAYGRIRFKDAKRIEVPVVRTEG